MACCQPTQTGPSACGPVACEQLSQILCRLVTVDPACGGQPSQRPDAGIPCVLFGARGFDQMPQRRLIAVVDACEDTRQVLGDPVADQPGHRFAVGCDGADRPECTGLADLRHQIDPEEQDPIRTIGAVGPGGIGCEQREQGSADLRPTFRCLFQCCAGQHATGGAEGIQHSLKGQRLGGRHLISPSPVGTGVVPWSRSGVQRQTGGAAIGGVKSPPPRRFCPGRSAWGTCRSRFSGGASFEGASRIRP